MRVYCVNLKRSTARRAKMEVELEKLSLPYAFIDAVDGRALSNDERRGLYSSWRTRLRHGVDLQPGELGCALSHLEFFRRIIAENEVGFVLEDDVSFGDEARQAFKEVALFLKDAKGPTLVQLPGLDRDLKRDKENPDLFVKVRHAMGTYAYGVNPEAARLLLEAFTPVKMPIDKYAYLIKRFGLNYFVYPKLVLSVDLDDSTIGKERFVSSKGARKILFKAWRLLGVFLDRILPR